MKTRINEAVWLPKYERWQLKVQREGVRRTFTSAKPGREGKAETHAKAEAWINNQTMGENMSVTTAYTMWVDSLLSENVKDKSRQLWRNWIEERIGKKKMCKLTEGNLQTIINDMAKAGLAQKSMAHMRFTLTAFVKFCRINRITTLMPESLHVPKGAKKGEKAILTPDDIKKLFSAQYDGDWYINLFRLGVLTGMRPGELFGLQWADISDGKIKISRAINFKNETTSGKNDNARRTIAYATQVETVLAAQRRKLNTAGIVTMWVFPNKEGNHAVLSTVANNWRRFVKSEGMTKTSPYCWRHTFVSVTSELPDGLKKRIVGHSQNMDTEGVYGHEVVGDIEKAAELIEGTFSGILQKNGTSL